MSDVKNVNGHLKLKLTASDHDYVEDEVIQHQYRSVIENVLDYCCL